MHVYAFYIVAAVFAVFAAFGMRKGPRAAVGPVVRRAAIVAAVAVLATAAYIALPWYVVREAIVNREDVSVETGGRDLVFYRSGFYTRTPTERHRAGRVRSCPRNFPAEERLYQIVVRMDPAAPAPGTP
jgi:hypothetical protein